MAQSDHPLCRRSCVRKRRVNRAPEDPQDLAAAIGSGPEEKSNRNNLCHYWPVMTMKASVHQRRHAPCEENETADVREPGALGAKLLGENEDR